MFAAKRRKETILICVKVDRREVNRLPLQDRELAQVLYRSRTGGIFVTGGFAGV